MSAHHAVHVVLVSDPAAECDAPLALGRRQRLQLLADPVPGALGIAKLLRALTTTGGVMLSERSVHRASLVTLASEGSRLCGHLTLVIWLGLEMTVCSVYTS